MSQRDDDIYASAPLRRLLDAQTRVLMARLQRCSGPHALLLTACAEDVPPALPLLGHWTTLQQTKCDYRGDLTIALDEPLPFIDDAFDLVLLRHVLEATPIASALLDEAIRTLAPGGVLALTGIHPISGWRVWFSWRTRGQSRSLRLPFQLGHRLQQAGLDIERAQRVGEAWPTAATRREVSANRWGGGYILIVRKRRRMATPLRITPSPMQVPAHGHWSAGTRRSSTQ